MGTCSPVGGIPDGEYPEMMEYLQMWGYPQMKEYPPNVGPPNEGVSLYTQMSVGTLSPSKKQNKTKTCVRTMEFYIQYNAKC